MAEVVTKQAGTYQITWESKPLGFSIVMDTTGNNAYVSSIQNTRNVDNGLRLAAQIIAIGNNDVEDMKHDQILGMIKKATCPLTLTFRQRTFANSSDKKEKALEIPDVLKFAKAPANIEHRVNGYFTLVDEGKELNCGRPIWEMISQPGDIPVRVWYWDEDSANSYDKGKMNVEGGIWMITRAEHVNTDKAYACVQTTAKYPTDVTTPWKVYDRPSGDFLDISLEIVQSQQ